MILKRIFSAVDALAEAGDFVPGPVADSPEVFADGVRARAIHLGSVTNAEFGQALRKRIERARAGGENNDLPTLRAELKLVLRDLNYTPETGFPGDVTSQAPAVGAGSIKDLSSDFRLNHILETHTALFEGEAQRQRGKEPTRAKLFPAWQLVRVAQKKVPRGSPGSGTVGWSARWLQLGGPMTRGGKLAALKDDPIWQKLGDPTHFRDCLNVDHPPFAYGSGMGWRELTKVEATELGLLDAGEVFQPGNTDEARTPEPVNSTARLDDDFKARLREQIKAKRDAAGGDAVRYSSRLERELEKARESYAAE